MKFVIIIPTYNEAGNIEKLIRSVEPELAGTPGHQFLILVVDGHSPDGTGEIVKSLKTEFNNLILLDEGGKRGLGAAYITGMKYAIRNLVVDVVVEMDADFQHDPADLKRFVVQIDAGYDYVLGSRFTKGGSIPSDWEFYRKFLSVVGNFFSRIILNLPNISDYTTGFKASRVKGYLEKIDLDRLASRGFGYKIHLLSQMVDLGAKVKEIPIHFRGREEGVSKMERNNPLESLRIVLLIRLDKNRQLIQRFSKFLMVGFWGLVLDFAGYSVLVRVFNWVPFLASIASGQTAIISNFYWNNRWTYADRQHKSTTKFLLNLLFFLLSSNFGVSVIRGSIIFLLTHFWGKDLYVLYYFIGTFFLVIYNFIVYSKVIWRRKPSVQP